MYISTMQASYSPDPDTLAGERIAVLESFDLNDADNTKDCIWMSGVVLRVSDWTWSLTKLQERDVTQLQMQWR